MKKIVFLFLCFIFLPISFANADFISPKNQLIIVNKAINRAAYYDDGTLVRVFKVATGREASFTPVGDFTVIRMVKNMPYYPAKIPGGAPNNPLGPRWIGLGVPGTAGFTYGLHGNAAPWSIGTYASHGCVRMYNEEVTWLYDRVTLGTKVSIVWDNKTFDEIAASKGYVLSPINHVSYEISLLGETATYSEPHYFTKANISLPTEKVAVFEEAGNWKHVKTGNKTYWIRPKSFTFDQVIKSDGNYFISQTTKIYSSPNNSQTAVDSISNSFVSSFEKAGDWIHIQYSHGDGWVEKSNLVAFK